MRARDGAVTGAAARGILSALPLRWPWLLEVTSDADRATAPGDIPSFPAVAKAEGIAHRQQVSAVWCDVTGARTAGLVLDLFAASFGYPLSLAEQIPHEHEFALGWQRRTPGEDILMFGAGGTEVGSAVDFRLLPLSRREAGCLVREHVPGAARQAQLVAVILALQDLVSRIPGEGLPGTSSVRVREIDLNPITFDATGALTALDWKIFRGD
jgi:hypothetical protein